MKPFAYDSFKMPNSYKKNGSLLDEPISRNTMKLATGIKDIKLPLTMHQSDYRKERIQVLLLQITRTVRRTILL